MMRLISNLNAAYLVGLLICAEVVDWATGRARLHKLAERYRMQSLEQAENARLARKCFADAVDELFRMREELMRARRMLTPDQLEQLNGDQSTTRGMNAN